MSGHPHPSEAYESVTRRAHGIPTPPYSETTSSASGSAGRARKDSSDTCHSTAHHTPEHTHRSSQRLQPPVTNHAGSVSSRSPSAASSSTNTGSDTVGARSPPQPHETTFRASRPARSTLSTMANVSAANHTSTPTGSLNGHTSVRQERGVSDDTSTQHPSASPSVVSAYSSRSTDAPFTRSPGERRKRRSEMHEREVSQIRSESRLGYSHDGDEDDANEQQADEQHHHFPPSSYHKYTPRKSANSTRNTEAESATSDHNSPTRRFLLPGSDAHSSLTPPSTESSRYTGIQHFPRLVRTAGRSTGRQSLDDRISPATASRSPMPAEFRLPGKEVRRAFRAAHQRYTSNPDDSDGDEGREEHAAQVVSTQLDDSETVHSPASTRRESLGGIQEESTQPAPAYAQRQRRRYASDAAVADEGAAILDRDPSDTQGGHISVDASAVHRQFSRGSQQSTPSSSARRLARSSEIGSPSEEARARKLSSTSSGRSQKSSSSASELHRAASRVSMRRQYGSDLFFAEPLPSETAASAHSNSPSVRTDHSSSLTLSSDRSRPYYDQRSRGSDAAQSSLRNQIEDLHVARAGTEAERRHLPPVSLRTAQLGSTRSSLDLKSPTLGSLRPQSVLGLQRTPNNAIRAQHMHQYPATDPQQSRFDRRWPTPEPHNSSDAAHRIHELVSLRDATSQRRSAPRRSATAMGAAPETVVTRPIADLGDKTVPNSDAPAPIRNLAIRLSQYEDLYSKEPSGESAASAAVGPHTARTVELMGAIARGTSTMWAELSSMHPIATEGHLMGREGDAFTEAFGQLDEGLAFANKLVLEQARAIQDLLFLLDRTEKERQAQFNRALVDMGQSPRSFSRIGDFKAPNSGEAGSSSVERDAHLLRRATSSVRGDYSLQSGSPSPFTRPARGLRSAERGGTLTASQIRSMTSLGHSSTHARSTSELSTSSSAAQRRLDRVALQNPSEASQDSPLLSRRSVIGRPFPTSDATQLANTTSSMNASGGASASVRPAPAFTPRRPRLSNPSVSNATASFQPSAASVASSAVASSPESSLHNGHTGTEPVESEGSTVAGGVDAEADEFGRVSGDPARNLQGGETVRQSMRGAWRTRDAATVRGGGGGGARVVDTLASQLDSLHDEQADAGASGAGRSAHRRHTINFSTTPPPSSLLGEADDPARSPPKLSQYGLTKSANPPPRPPRHVQRPSEESISSAGRVQLTRRDEPSTPTSSRAFAPDLDTPRAADHRAGYIHDLDDMQRPSPGAASVVRSLGRSAARRVSRVLGSAQP